MVLSSMENLLERKFGMNGFFPGAKLFRKKRVLEINLLAMDLRRENDSAFLVEFNSDLTKEDVRRFLKTIKRFPKFAPDDMADRKLYGIVATRSISEDLRNKVLKKGLYLARISGETCKLQVPTGFIPKAFGGKGDKANRSKRTKKSKR